MAKPLILVTGATGTVGSELVRELTKAGEHVRVLTRDPRKSDKFAKGVEVAIGDLEKPKTLTPAFKGVEKLFLLATGPMLPVMEDNAYNASVKAGVKHIVKLSGRHMDADFMSSQFFAQAHSNSEQRLRTLGVSWTIMRPGAFASNFLLWLDRKQNGIFLPVGDGKDSFIDPRDIGAVAAKLLTTSGHNGLIYEITGEESLSFTDVAEKISRAIGKKVTFQNITEEASKQGMLSAGVPQPIVRFILPYFAAIRNGKNYALTTAVSDLLGRPAHTFDEWAHDNAAALSA